MFGGAVVLDTGGLDDWTLGVSQPRWSVGAWAAAGAPEPDCFASIADEAGGLRQKRLAMATVT